MAFAENRRFSQWGTMTVLLKADHVTKKFGGLTAVNRVDFEIEVGMIA